VRGVDSDLDGDGSSADLLPLQCCDGLLLFCLTTNVDKAITLALPGLTPAPADDAGADDVNASFGEKGRKTGIVNAETEVGDEKHGLGWLASGILTSGASWAGGPGLFGTRLFGRRLRGRLALYGGGISSTVGGSVSVDFLGLASRLLLLFLWLSGFARIWGRGGIGLWSIAICLGL
jgi:hypothetical protein